jgi:hypothetical protein
MNHQNFTFIITFPLQHFRMVLTHVTAILTHVTAILTDVTAILTHVTTLPSAQLPKSPSIWQVHQRIAGQMRTQDRQHKHHAG